MGLVWTGSAWGRTPDTLRHFVLALVLATAGCGSQPATVTGTDPSAPSSEDAQRAAEEARKAAEAECISKAFNEAVLSPQNVTATLDSMMGQSLDGCPNDFTSGFVTLRTAVRNYAQTLGQIEAHKKEQDAALGYDAANLVCSVFSGEQCAPSSIQGWVDTDNALKAQDAANRAAIQSAYDALEAVAAQHGVYIRTAPASPSSAPDTDAAGAAQ